MATVYKVEIVSHWVNYSDKEIEKIIQKALEENVKSNEVFVKAKRER